ncbi:MAG: SGNH/GDSL hydrolase family protein [Lachnospiraceae bacterium]|nr:SGNH/GDSL hydrolase family protein [Lachnospiraceae bacterium]
MGGPKAPKDPTKKRPNIFVLYDKTIEAYAKPEGGSISPLFLDNGRLSNYAKTIGRVEDNELLELLNTAEGFKKLVHSIGVSVSCENKEQEAEFVLHMYGKTDMYQSGTRYVKKLQPNGSEVELLLSEIDWSADDVCVGQFVFRFPANWEVATINVRLYLNDGYTAPEFIPDAPVDFDSKAYKAMIAKSLVSLGNNVRLKRAIEKAKAGEDVTVAFIGGSITEGAGATPSQKTCYSKVAYDCFCRRFAKGDNVHYTKAGVGGTSSELGMIRYERDILGRGAAPDVVIVEFAVNDEGDETKGDCYETLVRKILFSENAPAVILLFSVFENDWNLQERLSPVGVRYDLPMVSVRDAVVEQFYLPADNGRIISKNRFFYDIYHPTSDGHRIMAECLDNLFAKADEALPGTEPDYAGLETVFKPEFVNVRLLDRKDGFAGAEISCGSFTESDMDLHYVEMNLDNYRTPMFPNNWTATGETGDEPFVIKIKSPYLLVITKDTGSMEFGKADIYVDGEYVLTADPHAVGWTHSTAQIAYRGRENTVHTVEIRKNPETKDKKFTILGFGYQAE